MIHLSSLIGVLGLDPEKLLNDFGLIGLFLIVFAESGLFFGFFLPGDSLLFTAGLLVATNIFHHSIVVVVVGVVVAAILGDQVAYRFGSKVGPALFAKPRSRFFNPKHVVRAQEFFDHHGARTIVIARFVPIVRTFAPIVAGVAKMPGKVFSTYNIAGGVLWGAGVTLAGFALGKRFPSLGKNIELLSLVIIAVSFIPVVIDVIRHRRKAQ
jgi:membrane-associated protein